MENKPIQPKKRKRDSPGFEKLTQEEKRSKIESLNLEIESLIKYFSEVSGKNSILEQLSGPCTSIDQEIACLIEESELPYSKLVEKVYEKVKGKEEETTLVSVQNKVLQIGQRLIYGVAPNADAIALEDSSEHCLWCWETRDPKFLPKAQRGLITIRRTCRKKIQDRISAVSAMIAALQALESLPNLEVDMMKASEKLAMSKASEKLAKVLNEADIRLLVENLLQKNGMELAEKEAKQKEKALVKELERSKRELEKEKKRMDREQLKEKLHNAKEQKRLQEEAEKEERLREAENKKQIKRQQEEAEREQRRREKEEALSKQQLSLKKQANLMDRFFKRKTNNNQEDPSSPKAVTLDSIEKGETGNHNAVTLSMDSTFSLNDNLKISELYRSHRDIWNKLGRNIRSAKSRHWGMRQKPKTTLIKELKLQGSSSETKVVDKFTTPDKSALGNMNVERVKDDWADNSPDARLCHIDDSSPVDVRICNRSKKLLQFDKSHRPAYYGTLSVKSDVVGPRHPLRKDSNLDYDVQSDEEWEEEDPGESLSDCDKDEEEEKMVEDIVKEDEDENEDGFLVPDGYLSENEGVQVDSMETDSDDDITNSPRPKQDPDSEEFRALFQLQKRIHNITEHALQKNQPMIISNLMYEKNTMLSAEDLSGTSKLEQMFLQALSLQPFFGGSPIEISNDNTQDEDQDVQELQNNGGNTPVLQERTDVLEKELSKIVSCIKSCPQGIGKIVELLQKSFPSVSKTQLASKVREISVFLDGHWQVKKEILDKLGLTVSPEKSAERPRGITAFFSKRCLPPAGGPMKMDETSPQQKQKTEMHSDDKRCIIDIQ